MSKLPEQANEINGYAGLFFAAFLVIFVCSLFFVASPPLGLAIFLLWVLPSLIHAWANIARQSRYLPLPWEDQFAMVILAFVLQIPLWLTAGFLGFLLGALAFDLLVQSLSSRTEPPPIPYLLFWVAATLGIYIALFLALLLWTSQGYFSDDQSSKCISIRDAKPIHHPF